MVQMLLTIRQIEMHVNTLRLTLLSHTKSYKPQGRKTISEQFRLEDLTEFQNDR